MQEPGQQASLVPGEFACPVGENMTFSRPLGRPAGKAQAPLFDAQRPTVETPRAECSHVFESKANHTAQP